MKSFFHLVTFFFFFSKKSFFLIKIFFSNFFKKKIFFRKTFKTFYFFIYLSVLDVLPNFFLAISIEYFCKYPKNGFRHIPYLNAISLWLECPNKFKIGSKCPQWLEKQINEAYFPKKWVYLLKKSKSSIFQITHFWCFRLKIDFFHIVIE